MEGQLNCERLYAKECRDKQLGSNRYADEDERGRNSDTIGGMKINVAESCTIFELMWIMAQEMFKIKYGGGT